MVMPSARRLRITIAACSLLGWCHGDSEFIPAASEGEWGFQREPRERLLEGISENITHSKKASDANFVCGQYARECQVAAGIPNGPDLWMSSEATYERDGTYAYKEYGFFNHSTCVRNEPWLVMTYTGTWKADSLSPYVKDKSLVSMDITSVWLKILHEEVCIPNQFDRTLNICLNTLAAIQVMCPCNGWPWTMAEGKASRERNIGMFCRPLDQCPLIHESYLQRTQYVTYSATEESGCFSQASPDVKTGWESPMAETPNCLTKREPMACTVAKAAAFRAVDERWRRCLTLCSMLLAAFLSTTWPQG